MIVWITLATMVLNMLKDCTGMPAVEECQWERERDEVWNRGVTKM